VKIPCFSEIEKGTTLSPLGKSLSALKKGIHFSALAFFSERERYRSVIKSLKF
jgi:hypothetical protein